VTTCLRCGGVFLTDLCTNHFLEVIAKDYTAIGTQLTKVERE